MFFVRGGLAALAVLKMSPCTRFASHFAASGKSKMCQSKNIIPQNISQIYISLLCISLSHGLYAQLYPEYTCRSSAYISASLFFNSFVLNQTQTTRYVRLRRSIIWEIHINISQSSTNCYIVIGYSAVPHLPTTSYQPCMYTPPERLIARWTSFIDSDIYFEVTQQHLRVPSGLDTADVVVDAIYFVEMLRPQLHPPRL